MKREQPQKLITTDW